MIDKMMKYSFILLSGESEAFLERLQELGVVDITRSTKPVDEKSSQMLEKILNIRKAIGILETLDYSADPDFDRIKTKSSSVTVEGCKMKNTLAADQRLSELKLAQAAAFKLLKQTAPWGEYDAQAVKGLADKGVCLHYYCIELKKFDPSWTNQWPLEIISEEGGRVYFVTVSKAGEDYSFPVPEIAEPVKSVAEINAEIKQIALDEINQKALLLCLKEKHLEHMKEGLQRKTADLDRYIASTNGSEAAEGYICTFEGFAPVDEQENLDRTFDELGVLYIKEEATEQDNPPIKLRNNGFSKLFECLTGMYGMPVYGEWDPTPILSVFFLLFFAMCMGDAGYGIVLIIYGLLQDRKIVNISMFDGLGKLIAVLGAATTVVGFFLGTAFGVDLTTVAWIPESLKGLMLTGNISVGGSEYALQMVLALCIGVFHLCLAMIIKALLYTERFGFKENISTWGWLILIVGGLVVGIVSMLGVVPQSIITAILIAIAVVSVLAIFIFNKPGRNPLINVGAGLWDTYNMVTGILGDVLSYIRLYALGLAGGMLGGAFNDLGMMVRGDDPTWEWLPFVLILLLGHVLNLLMSCLGAFVHPLRLTFVEYFKNSGYEGKGQLYNPLKKQ